MPVSNATPKATTIQDILGLISKTYLPSSGVYQNVQKALEKMTRAEVQGLYVMILTSVNRD